jgi:hypothetical protein
MYEYEKEVLLPLRVPKSDYCWDSKISCQYFDNPGGHGQCIIEVGFLKRDIFGLYPKPTECLNLKENK